MKASINGVTRCLPEHINHLQHAVHLLTASHRDSFQSTSAGDFHAYYSADLMHAQSGEYNMKIFTGYAHHESHATQVYCNALWQEVHSQE